ncbi:GNAT family N-acetyltransferase [Nonomuraea endophytica]|uniref:GNAT superfamily N-acetyltransferase n=1 Tax=Nonomuraea endophytica TaxID=714136 RepID=A0A7W8EK25_9ACTN|nr:GNAT family N-acetyltransferase [Nonomuraea endophytica]MBB5081267.1 GNAT superfamily N-acetyltransferase [Nonomuraea endophytica]
MIERLTGESARARVEALVTVYREAFGPPPWNEGEDEIEAFRVRLAEDSRRAGFVAVLATSDGRPCGFGTAFTTPSPLPQRRSYTWAAEIAGAERLTGALEVTELAVSPQARGRGLAGRMLDELCAGAPRRWLLTSTQAPDAVRLYERLGWWRLNDGPGAIVFTWDMVASDVNG